MENNLKKPKLIAFTAPWQISPSVPCLKIQKHDDGRPASATFIGHFGLDDFAETVHFGTEVEVIPGAPDFQPTPMSIRVPFRMVRITFDNGRKSRVLPAVSDREIILESAFDWSAVPGYLLADETGEQNVERSRATWLSSGTCPDPGMYEVQNLPWLAEIGAGGAGLRHYILLGHDEYAEVLASGCSWESGQSVD